MCFLISFDNEIGQIILIKNNWILNTETYYLYFCFIWIQWKPYYSCFTHHYLNAETILNSIEKIFIKLNYLITIKYFVEYFCKKKKKWSTLHTRGKLNN